VKRIGRTFHSGTRAFLFVSVFSSAVLVTIAGVAVAAGGPGQAGQAKGRTSPDKYSYLRWLEEDAAYIVAPEEHAAFQRLTTNEEREKFVEQFWLRRDPTPGTAQNEFKEEHYRRITYVNEHFASSVPGWKTDRGRIYIMYGPPDEVESHPTREKGEFPFERWFYRHIEGIGDKIVVEFVDRTGNGDYRITVDPRKGIEIK